MKVIGEEPVRVIVPPMVEEMKQLGLPGGGDECPVRCSNGQGR